MKVVVVGSGGREHALAWKVASSLLVEEVICIPGNPGTAGEPKTSNLPLPEGGVRPLSDAIARLQPDLVVIGPEQPLVAGLADLLHARSLAVVGPSAAAAELEGSKAFAKEIMRRAGVPTARYEAVDSIDVAIAAIDRLHERFDRLPVIKADGLAAGKGVIVPETLDEARRAAADMLTERRFGAAGQRVVIEERLEGIEASYIVLADGRHYMPLTSSQDHKRAFDGGQGPNTGGMGAFAPTPHVTPELERTVQRQVIERVLSVMAEEGLHYRGFLYAGLMLTAEGPRVLEFNVRSGDPETQAVLFGLDDDLVPFLQAAATGELGSASSIASTPAATVVMASRGYPGNAETGFEIRGLARVAQMESVKVFHAGTAQRGDRVVTSGGRVLAVTARGESLERAIARVYEAVAAIEFEGAHYRRDIGR